MYIRIRKHILCCALSVVGSTSAFNAFVKKSTNSKVVLKSTIDRSTVTTKEFADVCGTQFDAEDLGKRLERTEFLYPKHVEVIDDIAPLANKAVDDIVSFSFCSSHMCHYTTNSLILMTSTSS